MNWVRNARVALFFLVSISLVAFMGCQVAKKSSPPVNPTPDGPGILKVQFSEDTTQAMLEPVVRLHRSEIQGCFDRDSNPGGLPRKATVEWEIMEDGKTGAIKVVDSPSVNIAQCLEKEIATWKFSRPSRSGLVLARYIFIDGKSRKEGQD